MLYVLTAREELAETPDGSNDNSPVAVHDASASLRAISSIVDARKSELQRPVVSCRANNVVLRV